MERKFRRLERFLKWLTDGYGRHCIPTYLWVDLTPERVEKLYNVDFGN